MLQLYVYVLYMYMHCIIPPVTIVVINMFTHSMTTLNKT